MRTVKYKKELKKLLNDKFENYIEHEFDFFDYEENGVPSNDLIFCNYKDFDLVINSFFRSLILFLYDCNDFNTIKNHSTFPLCIIEFFKKTSLSTGKLAETVKNQYLDIKKIDESEFNKLIKTIQDIKEHYKSKYLPLYNDIRDNLAKDILLENKIHLCPYCKRNYINVITSEDDDTLIVKPDLDHFYDKAKYIFLAATLENLVPSCSVCNSRLKGSKDFYENKHIHPLEEYNVLDQVTFDFIGDSNTIYIKEKHLLDMFEQSSLDTFKIEEIYNTHKEVLFNIQRKYHHYNKVKRNNILKLLPELTNRENCKIELDFEIF